MVCHIVKQIGTSCSQQNVLLAAFPWRQATGGSRRSTITTTVSASTARCAKRISRDRVSLQREDDLSAKLTPARSPQQIMYNSDTVYSTTTFRPVSPSPITPPVNTPSPHRTRKLETPLHFDGGLFSDIRSTDGKLLSTVTVDRVQRSTRHDVSDSPNIVTDGRNYVDDVVKTETITNKDVITVKFTPVPPELDAPRLLTPSQVKPVQQKSPVDYIKEIENADIITNNNLIAANYASAPPELDSLTLQVASAELDSLRLQTASPVRPKSPVEYIQDNFQDLQSYKIVSSLCKEKLFERDNTVSVTHVRDEITDSFNISEPNNRTHSPLANLLISKQLTKIDSYLQESLEVCSGLQNRIITPINIEGGTNTEEVFMKKDYTTIEKQVAEESYKVEASIQSANGYSEKATTDKANNIEPNNEDIKINRSKLNSLSNKQPGVLSAIYNMPIHYHAAILCFLLIVYNLVYQYIKQNCRT